MKNVEFSRREFIKISAGSAVVMLGSGGCAFLSKSGTENEPRGHYKVFSKGKIGDLEVKNRLVKTATDIGATTDDCNYLNKGDNAYRNWSKGGAGMIISGHMTVVPQSRKDFLFNHNLTCIYADRFIPQLSKMAGAVHDADGDCKIIAQINHIGMDSISNPISASSVPWPFAEKKLKKKPHALSISEIKEIRNLYVAAAKRAKTAGFDGIQLHGAHSFLLNTFLSPYSNKRIDLYGGSVQNMMRIVKEITDEIKSSLGSEYPVLIKVNCFDKFPFDKTSTDTYPRFLSELAKTGVDAIEISEDTNNMDETKRRAHYVMYDEKVDVDIPLILTGGNKSVEKIEKIASRSGIDYFGFGRPMILEPNLPNRWLKKVGNAECDCISCNECLTYLLEGNELVTCQAFPKLGEALLRV